ncbi:MAG: adenylate/guanylate cyclase domain-containing protein [Pseudomonadota bacterium]
MSPALDQSADRGFEPLSLRFNDAALERAYIGEHNQRAARPLRVVVSLLIFVVIAQTAVEYYGVQTEAGARHDLWRAALPWRVADVILLLGGLALTWLPMAIRHGQPVVAAFLILLFGFFMSGVLINAAAMEELWIERLATLFNFSATLAIVALGLLFRYAAPLVFAMTIGFALVVAGVMANPFAPVFIAFATVVTMSWVAYSIERARREAWAAAADLADEKALSERLLLNVLPPSIAQRMRSGETLIADSHEEATVVFADIVNFTPLSSSMSPEALVAILDEIFAAFDAIAERHDLEKIKTIGDAYMMAAGLPTERSGDPAHALSAAIAMRSGLAEIAGRRGVDISMRAGVHIGPVVAGVIGRSKFVYDLWGDSVNVASRMESTAPVGAIQVTEEVHARLGDRFAMSPRGEIEVKGKGLMRAWLVGADEAPD